MNILEKKAYEHCNLKFKIKKIFVSCVKFKLKLKIQY